MVESLRRLFWLAPLLTLGSGALFALLTSTLVPPPPGQFAFFNRHPANAEGEALLALDLLEHDEPRGTARLVELGGAALPHVLSRLDTFAVKRQKRIAHALWPLVVRMGLDDSTGTATGDVVDASDYQLIFWRQFYEEHGLEFRPLSVQRLVKRLAARDLRLRRADLLVVDSFALPALIEELGRVRTDADVERVRRLSGLIAHVSGRAFELPRAASISQAHLLATEIRVFWDRHSGAFSQMGKLELLGARITQTEFSIWVRQSWRQLNGVDASSLVPRLLRGGRVSAPLFALALLGALVLGPALAAWVQVLQMRSFGSAGRHAPIRIILAFGLCTLIPGTLLHTSGVNWMLGLSATLSGTLSSAYLLQRELADRIDWRTRHVLSRQEGLGRVRAVVRWLGPSIPTLAPLAAAEAAIWVTCLELGAHVHGLGQETIHAVASADLPWLMMAGLSLGVVTGGMQLVCDALLGTARLRWGEA